MVTKEMSIGEIVEKWPNTAEIFKQHGMGCLGCAIAHFETLEEGANAHGIDIDALLQDLSMAATRYNPDEGKCSCGCGKH